MGSELTHDSTDFMNLKQLPENIVIIGAGYIGMEFATNCQCCRRGTSTVLLRHNRALRKFNQDYVKQVIADLEKRGVKFIYNAQVDRFEERRFFILPCLITITKPSPPTGFWMLPDEFLTSKTSD